MPIPSSQRARPAAVIRSLPAREDYENAFSRFAAKRLGPSPQSPQPFPSALLSGESQETEKALFFRSLWAGRRCAAASRFIFFKVETLWSIFSLKRFAFQTIRPVVSRKLNTASCPSGPCGRQGHTAGRRSRGALRIRRKTSARAASSFLQEAYSTAWNRPGKKAKKKAPLPERTGEPPCIDAE